MPCRRADSSTLVQKLVEFGRRENRLHSIWRALVDVFAHRDDAHAQCRSHNGDSAPDAAQTDESEGRSRDFARAVSLPPHGLLAPYMLLLHECRLRNLLCQSEDQRDDVLGHDRPMDFRGVGQDDIAVDQLLKQKLDEWSAAVTR